MEHHKRIEQRLYDGAAAPFLRHDTLPGLGAAGVPPEFRAPYSEFERRVTSHARAGAVVLDIGAGLGNFSATARGAGRVLVATDISPVALAVARNRARREGVELLVVCADAERLPVRDGSVDLVTSAGVLYCLDFQRVEQEIRRLLRPDGAWVIVDSLDESPFYRLNRWIGFLRRRRTALAVRNIPTVSTLRKLDEAFRAVDISYHGVLAFLVPFLRPIVGAVRAGNFVSAADRRLGWLRRWAFKVVVVAQHPR